MAFVPSNALPRTSAIFAASLAPSQPTEISRSVAEEFSWIVCVKYSFCDGQVFAKFRAVFWTLRCIFLPFWGLRAAKIFLSMFKILLWILQTGHRPFRILHWILQADYRLFGVCTEYCKQVTICSGHCTELCKKVTDCLGYCTEFFKQVTYCFGYCTEFCKKVTDCLGYGIEFCKQVTDCLGYCTELCKNCSEFCRQRTECLSFFSLSWDATLHQVLH
jgi:hypothetical protein